jgi:hypothetical protein
MTGLEDAEMRFLRSVTGYTRLDKTRSEVIRKELEISGIQDVRLKYKQNWINQLEKWTTPDSRNTPSPTNPEIRRDCGRPRKRWQYVDAGTGQTN